MLDLIKLLYDYQALKVAEVYLQPNAKAVPNFEAFFMTR